MSAQTSYAINHDVAYAGLVYDMNTTATVSRSVETVAGIGFGVAVSRGTDKDKQVVLGGTDFLGITIRELSREGALNTGAIKYDEKVTASIMTKGYIWAVCPTGCTPGAAVKYVNATGVLDSGAAGAGETKLDNAVWDTTAAAGALGVIRLDSFATTAGA